MEWNDLGSGALAKTLRSATRFRTTSRGGPPNRDVHGRTIWSLSTGKVVDDCIPDDVPDEILHREMKCTDAIRVELVMKDPSSMYRRFGADVSEIYSQPRIAQEAAVHSFQGQKLQRGRSLDLTRNDPKTGEPWDLGCKKVQCRVRMMVMQNQQCYLIGSPPCAPLVLHNCNSASRSHGTDCRGLFLHP